MSPTALTVPEYVRIPTTDGLELVAELSGTPGAPYLVCVHGYPDSARVWDPLRELVAEDFRVVTYSYRGAGRSGEPESRSGYRLDQLASDLDSVLTAVLERDGADSDASVHLLAHDWGSIQTWHAVCGTGPASRVTSFTSISGPELGASGRWSRRGPVGARLTQLAHSWYIGFFHLPLVPEVVFRLGAPIATRLLPGSRTRELLSGLGLYRANILPELAAARTRSTSVPVRVLTPLSDRYVTPALQESARLVADDVEIVPVEGSHWVVRDDPGRIVRELPRE